jgi:hypothetical protein
VSTPPDDLTEGWPDDPQNAELARFARELAAARQELAPDAMARVEQRLQRELTARRPRRALFAIAAVAAAAVLLGVGAYLYLMPPATPVEPIPVVAQPVSADLVRDQYVIEFRAPPAAVQVERSLVRIDQHRSLFTD